MSKICTNIKQSQKLIELGIDVNSADTHYVRQKTDFMGNPVDGKWSEPRYGYNSKYAHYVVQNFSSYEKLPCWSLSALLGILPKRYNDNTVYIPLVGKYYGGDKFICGYFGDGLLDWTFGETPVDACYKMIVKLNELKLL